MKSCFFAFFNLNAFLNIIYSGTSEQEIAYPDKNKLELYKNISFEELIEMIELNQNTITVIKELYFESFKNDGNKFEDKDMLYAPDDNIWKSENYKKLRNGLMRFYDKKKAYMLIKYPHTSSFLSNFKDLVNNFNTNLNIDFLKNELQIEGKDDETIIDKFLIDYIDCLESNFDKSMEKKLDQCFVVSNKKKILIKKNHLEVNKNTVENHKEQLSMEEYNNKEILNKKNNIKVNKNMFKNYEEQLSTEKTNKKNNIKVNKQMIKNYEEQLSIKKTNKKETLNKKNNIEVNKNTVKNHEEQLSKDEYNKKEILNKKNNIKANKHEVKNYEEQLSTEKAYIKNNIKVSKHIVKNFKEQLSMEEYNKKIRKMDKSNSDTWWEGK